MGFEGGKINVLKYINYFTKENVFDLGDLITYFKEICRGLKAS